MWVCSWDVDVWRERKKERKMEKGWIENCNEKEEENEEERGIDNNCNGGREREQL